MDSIINCPYAGKDVGIAKNICAESLKCDGCLSGDIMADYFRDTMPDDADQAEFARQLAACACPYRNTTPPPAAEKSPAPAPAPAPKAPEVKIDSIFPCPNHNKDVGLVKNVCQESDNCDGNLSGESMEGYFRETMPANVDPAEFVNLLAADICPYKKDHRIPEPPKPVPPPPAPAPEPAKPKPAPVYEWSMKTQSAKMIFGQDGKPAPRAPKPGQP